MEYIKNNSVWIIICIVVIGILFLVSFTPRKVIVNPAPEIIPTVEPVPFYPCDPNKEKCS